MRSIPLLALFSAIGLGALVNACEIDHPDYLTQRKRRQPSPATPPTDDDEYVPEPEGLTPINAGDSPPAVPNVSWEARARQLEGEQARLYGVVFGSSSAANGAMAGKERSHVPKLELTFGAGDVKRVTVLVEHVMGGVDADGGPDARMDAADAAAAVADASVDARTDATIDASVDAPVDATSRDAAPAGPPVVHYVTTIYLRGMVDGKDTVVGLWELASSDGAPPSVTFTLPAGVTEVVAYEYCTMHGLWRSDATPT